MVELFSYQAPSYHLIPNAGRMCLNSTMFCFGVEATGMGLLQKASLEKKSEEIQQLLCQSTKTQRGANAECACFEVH